MNDDLKKRLPILTLVATLASLACAFGHPIVCLSCLTFNIGLLVGAWPKR